jgi:hypothetical protein
LESLPEVRSFRSILILRGNSFQSQGNLLVSIITQIGLFLVFRIRFRNLKSGKASSLSEGYEKEKSKNFESAALILKILQGSRDRGFSQT